MSLVRTIVDGKVVTNTAQQTSSCRTITRDGEKSFELRFKIDGVEGDKRNLSLEFTDNEMREMISQWKEHLQEELQEEMDEMDDGY